MKDTDLVVYTAGAFYRHFLSSDFKVHADLDGIPDQTWSKDTGWVVPVGDMGVEAANWLITNLPREFKIREVADASPAEVQELPARDLTD